MADPFQSDWIPNQDGVAMPQTAEQFAAIPHGTLYQDPTDGNVKRKGGGTLTEPPVEWHPFKAGSQSYLVNTRTGQTIPFGEPSAANNKELESAQRAYDAADRAWRAVAGNESYRTKSGSLDFSNDSVEKAKAELEAASGILHEKNVKSQNSSLPNPILPTAMQSVAQQPLSVASPQGTSGYVNPSDLITKIGSDNHPYKVLPTTRIEIGGKDIISPDSVSLPRALNPAQSALPDFGTPVYKQGTSGYVTPPAGGTTPSGTSGFKKGQQAVQGGKTYEFDGQGWNEVKQ